MLRTQPSLRNSLINVEDKLKSIFSLCNKFYKSNNDKFNENSLLKNTTKELKWKTLSRKTENFIKIKKIFSKKTFLFEIFFIQKYFLW